MQIAGLCVEIVLISNMKYFVANSRWKLIIGVLFAVFYANIALRAQAFGYSQDDVATVPFFSLLDRPEKYEGVRVSVVGIFIKETETEYSLWVSKERLDMQDMSCCLRIYFDNKALGSGFTGDKLGLFDKCYVLLEGTYRRSARKYCWIGAIYDVYQISFRGRPGFPLKVMPIKEAPPIKYFRDISRGEIMQKPAKEMKK